MNICKLVGVLLFPLLLLGCEPKPAPDSAKPPAAVNANDEAVAKPAATDSANVNPTVASSTTDANSAAGGAAPCVLKLGYEAWEPYQYTNLENKAAGLDIELIQAIADVMQCTVQPRQGSWTELVSALKAGELDLLPGASQTEARREFAYFSEPYRAEQFQLFVRSADSAKYPQTSLTDFIAAGHKVGIISDYFYGNEFAELSAQDAVKANFVEASLGELNLARLLDEDIDAMLEDAFVAHSLLRRKGLEQQIGAHPITLGNSDVYVMFSKVSVKPEQVQAFNQALAQLKQDGRYAAIVARYQQ